MMAKPRSKCITKGSRLRQEEIAPTIAWLSHRSSTHLFDQCLPQIPAAITMGSSSFPVMLTEAQEAGHCSWSQWVSQIAPKPQEPDASEHTTMSGDENMADVRAQIPFHRGAKSAHHWRSDLNSLLRLTWWWSSVTDVARSIILRRKQRPKRTTEATCWRTPMRDKSSLFWQAFLSPHAETSCCNRANLSVGRHAVRLTESNSMPRKQRRVLGPSILSGATGTPSDSHSASAERSALPVVRGGSTKRKSSK